MSGFGALYDRTKDADKDELRSMYGTLMSKARGHRAMDGSIIMLLDIDDNGEIERSTHVVAQRGSYVPPEQAKKYDLQIALHTDAFVDYDDLRRSALDSLAQAMEYEDTVRQ